MTTFIGALCEFVKCIAEPLTVGTPALHVAIRRLNTAIGLPFRVATVGACRGRLGARLLVAIAARFLTAVLSGSESA